MAPQQSESPTVKIEKYVKNLEGERLN